MSAFISRLGIRGQLLIAPAAVLILTTILGVISVRQLGASAEMAKQQAAETAAVEVLRDSNSRQFEGDRFQHLALGSTTRRSSTTTAAEAADVMKESADGFTEFAATARTPSLREEATKQAELVSAIQSERERALALVHVGAPVPPAAAKIIDGVEELIEQADESNDALVTEEQKVTDRIAADASATAARGKRLVIIVLALAALLAALVSFAMAQPLVRAARRLLVVARGIASGDLDQDVDVKVAGELGATAAAFGDMVAYLREMEQAAQRIADGDLTVDDRAQVRAGRARPRAEPDDGQPARDDRRGRRHRRHRQRPPPTPSRAPPTSPAAPSPRSPARCPRSPAAPRPSCAWSPTRPARRPRWPRPSTPPPTPRANPPRRRARRASSPAKASRRSCGRRRR